MATKNSAVTYAVAQQEIESILERLNNEELDVDTLSKEVAKAIELIDLCKKRLHKAETEVNKLFSKSDNEE